MATERSKAVFDIMDRMEATRSFSYQRLNIELAARGFKPLQRGECDRYVFKHRDIMIDRRMAAERAATAPSPKAEPLPPDDRDTLQEWLAECCERDGADVPDAAAYRTNSSKLYASWVVWCVNRDRWPGSNKSFSGDLTARGLTKRVTRVGAQFLGIRLR